MFKVIEKYRTPMQLLLGVVGVSFMGFGVLNFQTGTNNNYIVKVGDEAITRYELDRAIQNTEASGGVADRQAVFQTLVTQAYLREGAKRLGLTVSDDEIKQSIVDTPQFHNAQNQFDVTLFQQFLENAGLTEQTFMEQERERQLLIKFMTVLNTGVFSDAQANLVLNAMIAPRIMRSAPLNANAFADKVKTDDATLQKYYNEHKKEYALPQAVKFEFIKLSAKTLADKQSVSDDEIQKAINENKANSPAKRRISHILFNAPKDASADDKAKAKAEAEKVLTELKTNPTQFAELAKKYSQDSGSAENGGDLGEFAQNGSLGSKSLEDEAFKLEKGAVSGVVESDFGYHILQVTDVVNGGELSEADKNALIQQLKEKKAQQTVNQLREELAQLTFDKPTELKSSADKVGLPLETQSEWISRQQAEAQGIPKAVIETLFNEETFSKKRNAEPVTANGEVWFVRDTETRNETEQPFETVKEQVKADYIKSESARLAKEEANKLLSDLQSGKANANSLAELAWSGTQEVIPAGLRTTLTPTDYRNLMKAVPKDGKSAFALVELAGVPQIVEVQAIKAPEQGQALAIAKQYLAQTDGDTRITAYVDSLRSQIPTVQGAERLSDE